MRTRKVLTTIVAIIFISFIFLAGLGYYAFRNPPKHDISFVVSGQKIVSCNGNPIRNISIEMDSVNNKGYKVGEIFILIWKDRESEPPSEISINNIPSGYSLMDGLVATERLKIKENSSYIIKKYGGGREPATIKIWTDSLGNVYKTTHFTCKN